MYLIIDNKPYAIRDEKVYEVAFGDNGTIKLGDEVKDAKVEGKTYSYDEVSRKFNLKAKLQEKNVPTKELVDELNKQINALTKENANLKKQIEDLKPSKKVEEEIVEEVEEEKSNKKNK